LRLGRPLGFQGMFSRRMVAFVLASAAGLSAAAPEELDLGRMVLIRDTAWSICETVEGMKGDIPKIQDMVKGQLTGLLNRLSELGSQKPSEDLIRDTTDLIRDTTDGPMGKFLCRTSVFKEIYNTLAWTAGGTPDNGSCSTSAGGNSFECTRPAAGPVTIVGNGYQFLYSKGTERGGFGLYTYVLLTSSNSDRVKAMLEAVLKYTRQASALIALGGNPVRINVIYIPLTPGRDPGRNPEASEIASRYNFDLSQALIETICEMSAPEVLEICKTGLGSGPYLFSYAHPIGKAGKLTPPVLFVDLTRIQPGAFATLVDAYKEQIKSNDISDGEKINSLYIKALNVIETAKAWTDPVAHAAADFVRMIPGGSDGDGKAQ